MLEEYIQANHLCAEQYNKIESDIKNGVSLKDVYPKIIDIHDRANLLNMAKVLFYTDGDFSAAEQKAYDAIHHDQEEAVDFDKVEAAALQKMAACKQQLLNEEKKAKSHEGRIARLVDFITGIPDLYEDVVD